MFFFWQATKAAKKRVLHVYLDGLTFIVDEKILLPKLRFKPMNFCRLAGHSNQISHTVFTSILKQELAKRCYKLRVRSKRGKLVLFLAGY